MIAVDRVHPDTSLPQRAQRPARGRFRLLRSRSDDLNSIKTILLTPS